MPDATHVLGTKMRRLFQRISNKFNGARRRMCTQKSGKFDKTRYTARIVIRAWRVGVQRIASRKFRPINCIPM